MLGIDTNAGANIKPNVCEARAVKKYLISLVIRARLTFAIIRSSRINNEQRVAHSRWLVGSGTLPLTNLSGCEPGPLAQRVTFEELH
jgi:hypothetical protein